MSALELDCQRLDAYLQQHLPGYSGPLTASKFSQGQSNPTYLLEAGSGQYVLRRKPPGKLLKSAHAVDREFNVLQALNGSDVPVPDTHLLCTDDSVIGSWFYIMDYVPGRIYWDPLLPDMDNAQRRAAYADMNRVMAAIHGLDINSAGLADYGPHGGYFDRQTQRWSRQYRASETHTIAAMDQLLDWLPNNLPEDDGRTCLIHGDFRLDNLIFHPQEPRIIAVLDWELSTLGHPLADLSYQCMQWRLPYDALIKGLAGMDRTAHGIPTEAEYIQAYCERAGLEGIADWRFYLAFNFFRLAAIAQGVAKRALDGNASSEYARQVGAMTEPIAGMGLAVIASG